ncbi:hypothetical protein SAMN05444487_10844 [Marininema mesophilum]|uniref:Uncharacterized protein n=1 Tax=Marininema mesophilum TaxID=1048340 RepID=A0A1H2XSU0_9BACL|nr:hypothetical protein [Marininema mesophilum]SDW95855.1 hypothetical protein SAMN05444487_10844 [Marininema mesophilum]
MIRVWLVTDVGAVRSIDVRNLYQSKKMGVAVERYFCKINRETGRRGEVS